MKILYIEDDEWWRDDMAKQLESQGHEMFWADSIAYANSLINGTIRPRAFDAIICDGYLDPKEDGDGLRYAAKLHAEGRNVVIFSATSESRIPRGVPYVSKLHSTKFSETINRIVELLQQHAAR